MAEIADDNDFAISDLLSFAGEEVLGFSSPEIDGEEIEAHRSDTELDEIVVNGGVAEAGGFQLTVRRSDFEALPGISQQKGAVVESRDDEMEILKVTRSISHVVILCGQFAGQE